MQRLLAAVLIMGSFTGALAQQATHLLTRDAPYRLQPSDVLEVEYEYTPEYNQTATVEPDGTVRLKLIGPVKVASLSLDDATAAIKTKAAQSLKDPVITLTLKDFVKPHFTVYGEVSRPGLYDLRGEMTVLQGIAMTGGVKDTSKETQVVLVRKMNSEMAEVKVVNLKLLSSAKGVREDFSLQPDDMLLVPKNKLGKLEPYIRVASMGLTSLYGVALVK